MSEQRKELRKEARDVVDAVRELRATVKAARADGHVDKAERVEIIGAAGEVLEELAELIGLSADLVDRAKAAYHAYGGVTDFKNYQGLPMPQWEDLTEKIREAWIAATKNTTGLTLWKSRS